MIENILYIILALLGLGFLVFIHELGHYLIARKVGMRVEIFSIGFGKRLFSWKRKGVLWQMCILPFGGYVKIAGMEKENGKEPYEIKDGFFGKKPIDRIKVALMGPIVNIVFAFVVFSIVWGIGGRVKTFSEYTHKIGWMDNSSQLYQKQVRPGDAISRYDNKPFTGLEDLLKTSVMKKETLQIEGDKIDYFAAQKTPFNYTLSTYTNKDHNKLFVSSIGILSPATYLIYQPDNKQPNKVKTYDKQIKPGDRLVWMDGRLLFSAFQLQTLLNTSSVFVTIQRGEKILHTQLPRLKLQDFILFKYDKEEIDDWKHEAQIKTALNDLYMIPYYFNEDGVIEDKIAFIDEKQQKTIAEENKRSFYSHELKRGDKIVAVNAEKVFSSFDILKKLQTRKVLLIIQRNPALVKKKVLWQNADKNFDRLLHISNLKKMIGSIGTSNLQSNIKDMYLLKPIELQTIAQLAEQANQTVVQFLGLQEVIEKKNDPVQRKQIHQQIDKMKDNYILGVTFKDRKVIYNPNPLVLFKNVFVSIYQTLSALFSGSLSPKWMSGPVGIISVVQQSWSFGIKEALFWLGFISLNLGILNLLPIPILDGGHIVFSLVEMGTKKPIKAKTMEKIVIPFMILLILAFIYVTYHDLNRLFMKFFN